MLVIMIVYIVTFFLMVLCVPKWKNAITLYALRAKYALWYNAIGFQNIVQDFFATNKTDLPLCSGKTALITGGTRGIGLEVVKLLLQCDINVIIGCRNTKLGNSLLQKFREDGISKGNIEVFHLDTSTMESVKTFANEVKCKYEKIDCLINNAGIMFGPYTETPEGYESQFATNYLGHFLLTYLLLPELRKAGEKNFQARIVNVSSCAHRVGKINFEDINLRERYVPALGYAQSKLAQVLFTIRLNNLLMELNENIQVHAVHPGLVNTDIFNGTFWRSVTPFIINLFFKTPEQGAYSIIHACVSPTMEGKGGTFIENCQIYSPSRAAQNVKLQEKMFNFTNELLKIKDFGQPMNV